MALFSRLSTKEKMFFARNMAVMARSGMQVLDILRGLKQQTSSSRLKDILAQLIRDVKNGTALFDSFKKHEKIFGVFFINLVKVGELSGSLPENLDYLAEALEKHRELENKARGAMIYPIIVLVATLGMTFGMIFFIFPKILPIFESLKVDLPLTTRIFIRVANLMLHHGVAFIVVLIAFLVGTWLLLRLRSVRFLWQWLIIKTPVIGRMVVTFNIVQFSRTLALLLKSGTKIVQSLNIAADTIPNLVYKRQLKHFAREVGSGDTISNHLLKIPAVFPPTFSQMIGVGEHTGKLPETALFLADFYDKELDTSTKAVTNLLEPMLLLIMGVIVVFVALAIITPIYEVSQTLTK